MKTLTKVVLLSLLLASVVFTACSSPAPSVNKAQYDTAYQETTDAEATASRLRAENAQLKAELEALIAKRDALQKLADGKK